MVLKQIWFSYHECTFGKNTGKVVTALTGKGKDEAKLEEVEKVGEKKERACFSRRFRNI